MRNVFLVLLLANLVFAAWHAWVARPDATAGATPGTGSIQLLSAHANATASGHVRIPTNAVHAAMTPPQAPAVIAIERCVSVGPYGDVAAAMRAQALLEKAGGTVRRRTAERDVTIGIWVYLQGKPVQEAFRSRTLANLRAHGVPDAYVIRGDDEGADTKISLGLFNESARAMRLAKDVRKLGYAPTVADRIRKQQVFWLDVTLAVGGVLPPSLFTQASAGSSLQRVSCPPAQSAAPP